jgi:hypothetical protein
MEDEPDLDSRIEQISLFEGLLKDVYDDEQAEFEESQLEEE